MSYFARQLDAYAERFALSPRDRRRIARRWPLFKLFYWARSGSPALRAVAMPAFRLFAGHRVNHVLTGASGRRLDFSLSFDEFEFATFREVLWGPEYDAPVDLSGARTLVDLGANTGMATLRFMLAAPLEQVVCVEANPDLLDRLRQRIGEAATIEHAAVVGARPGEHVRFTLSDNPRHGSANPIAGRAIEVPATTLGELLDRHGLSEVDILKADIEGSEHDLLEQDGASLRRARTLFVEVHGDAARRARFMDGLRALGFTIVSEQAEQNALSASVVATRA